MTQGCQYQLYYKPCGEEIFDHKNKLCIFHTEVENKDSGNQFSFLIDEKIKGKYCDFTGYVFLKGWAPETKASGKEGFIITAYFIDTVKEKEPIWPK